MHRVGFIYALSNPAYPGLVKVGKTSKLAEDRAKKLQGTGVPMPFAVEFRAATSRPAEVERRAHELLAARRVARDREFFRVSVGGAIDAIEQALLEAGGIDAWTGEPPKRIKSGDRVAVTLEAGQLFVVLSRPSLSAEAEVFDVWQAHATGDLLELMGTHDPGFVAGFSDGEEGGAEDPVPFLDRVRSTPNGRVNGRERLVAGDRLLWLAPRADSDRCAMCVFEMVDHCQVVSRTWSARFGPGVPLSLNVPTYDALPESVVHQVRAALRMNRPRSWSPRSGGSSDGWAATATHSLSPEYWLPQLAPAKRPKRS